MDIPLDIIRLRLSNLAALRNSCNSEEGWNLQKESYGVKTYYQNHPDSSHVHCVRLDGDVTAPVMYLLALLHEVDLFTKWIPSYPLLGLRFAHLIDHPSPTELSVHLNVGVPWPLTDRYCFFHCDGIDCMDDPDLPQIGVVMSNLVSEADYGISETAVKTTFHAPSGVLLTPLGNGVTRVQVVVRIDPQLSIVPDWLIDLAVRNLAYLIIVQIRNAVEIVKSDPEYALRMADETSAFYNHIKKRLLESMPDELGSTLAFTKDD